MMSTGRPAVPVSMPRARAPRKKPTGEGDAGHGEIEIGRRGDGKAKRRAGDAGPGACNGKPGAKRQNGGADADSHAGFNCRPETRPGDDVAKFEHAEQHGDEWQAEKQRGGPEYCPGQAR